MIKVNFAISYVLYLFVLIIGIWMGYNYNCDCPQYKCTIIRCGNYNTGLDSLDVCLDDLDVCIDERNKYDDFYGQCCHHRKILREDYERQIDNLRLKLLICELNVQLNEKQKQETE